MIDGRLGIGIIGTGGISNAHADGYLRLGDKVKIIAVADIFREKAEAAAARWGVECALEDYHHLLEMDEIDAVSVCTYNAAHCQPTVDALKAGKHVLVEKPMAVNAQEAYRMATGAEESGKILMVGMKWRFRPEVLAAKQAVEDRLIGEIYYAEAIGWQQRGIPGGTFIKKETAGAGALMDNGVYTLDAVLYIMGHPKPLSVSASAGAYFGKRTDGSWDPNDFTVEDFGVGFVRLEGGITLFFGHSWAINFEEYWKMRVAGTEGGIELMPLKIFHGGYSDLKDVTPKELPQGSIDIWYEVARFVDAILEGKSSPVPGDKFLYTNVIFDGLFKSAELGREVQVKLPSEMI
ncbi:Gfo/Idh/MocA family oxidoreductase [bacterium]|nr:Gfo/Idh/MocA family oxidoreductase [bacterium]